MPRTRTDADLLRVSLAATWHIAETGGGATAAELAAASDVSVRTFHRMFPRKEDCIRPALADARRLLVDVYLATPGPAGEALVRAFTATAGGAFLERTRLLIPLIQRDAQLASVWDHELAMGRAEIAEALRARGDETHPRRAETRAALMMSLIQLALMDAAAGQDPESALRARWGDAAAIDFAERPATTTPRRHDEESS